MNRVEGDIIKAIKRIWDTLLMIIVIIEIILVIAFYGTNIFGIKTYVITSGSMIPKYNIGSLIYVLKNDPKEVKVKDAITFYMSNSKIVATHEVYQIDEINQRFYTRGINNKDSDGNIINDASPVPFSNYVGKVVFCIPYIGYVNKFITSGAGILIIIGITVLFLLISFLLDKKKNNGGKKEWRKEESLIKREWL